MSWMDDFVAEGSRRMGEASAGGSSGPLGVAGILSARRKRFAAELQDPNVRQRLMALTHAEVGAQGPQAQQAFMETIFNRAEARGKTLWDTMHGPYFPGITHQRTAASLGDPRLDSKYDSAFANVRDGSNISNYATGNASGTVGFAGGPQTFAAGGERFGIEGPDRRWSAEVRRAPQASPVAFNMQGATRQPVGVTTSIRPLDPGKIAFANAAPSTGWGTSLPPAAALEHSAGLAAAPGANMALAAALPAGEQMFAQGQRAAQVAETGVPVRNVQTVSFDGNGQPSAPVPYKLLNPGAADPQKDWVQATIDNAPKPQLAAADPLESPPAGPTRAQSGLAMPGTRSALGGPRPQAPSSPDRSPSLLSMPPPKANAWWENVNGDMTPKFLSDSRPSLPMPKAPDMTPKTQMNNPFKSFFGGWFA